MKNLILLIFSGLLLWGCGVSKTTYQQNPTSKITLNRGACFGSCPFYDLTIDGNGYAVFKGKKFVEKLGSSFKSLKRLTFGLLQMNTTKISPICQ